MKTIFRNSLSALVQSILLAIKGRSMRRDRIWQFSWREFLNSFLLSRLSDLDLNPPINVHQLKEVKSTGSAAISLFFSSSNFQWSISFLSVEVQPNFLPSVLLIFFFLKCSLAHLKKALSFSISSSTTLLVLFIYKFDMRAILRGTHETSI